MRLSVSALAAGSTLVLAGAASATTVRFDVVPTSDTSATSVTVTPGAEVPYQVYVHVISDNTTTVDNNGLSFFTLEVLTNLTVAQQPLSNFATLIADSFTVVQSLGTVQDDDIVQIGGGQNTFAGGTVTAGIGSGSGWQLIGEGKFLTPTTEGSYTVAPGSDSLANVFAAGSTTSATQATLQLGPGFTIVVAEASTSTTTGNTSSSDAVTKGVALGGLAVMIVLGALLLSSPMAAMIAIVLLPLLFVVLLMNGF